MSGTADLVARDYTNNAILRHIKSSEDGFLITISHVIQETHAGKFFYANSYNAALAVSPATFDLLLVTGPISPHLATMCDVGADATFEIYEGATTSSNGTGLTIFNANRLV